MNNINIKIDAFLPKFTPPKRTDTNGRVSENAQDQNTDSFSASEQAKKALGATQNDVDRLKEMLENSRNESDAEAKGFEDFAKCMKIAARIMNGDIVPSKDHKFLAEKYPDIYERAILMRRINPDPKKYKSLIEDEEEADEASEETPGEPLEIEGDLSAAELAASAAETETAE